MRNMAKDTDTLAGMNIATLKKDVLGAVRGMMREESVNKLCAQHPGPQARESPQSVSRSLGEMTLRHLQGQVQVLLLQ